MWYPGYLMAGQGLQVGIGSLAEPELVAANSDSAKARTKKVFFNIDGILVFKYYGSCRYFTAGQGLQVGIGSLAEPELVAANSDRARASTKNVFFSMVSSLGVTKVKIQKY
jgi:hypothetical protein